MRHISGTFAAAYRCCIYMSLNWVNIAKKPCNGKNGSILLLYIDAKWNIELNWVKIAKNSCNIKIGSILLEYIHIFGKFERRFIWHPFIFPNYWWKSCDLWLLSSIRPPFDILSFHGEKNPQIFVLHTWKSSNFDYFLKILPQYFWACKAKNMMKFFLSFCEIFLLSLKFLKSVSKVCMKKEREKNQLRPGIEPRTFRKKREKKNFGFGRE